MVGRPLSVVVVGNGVCGGAEGMSATCQVFQTFDTLTQVDFISLARTEQ